MKVDNLGASYESVCIIATFDILLAISGYVSE